MRGAAAALALAALLLALDRAEADDAVQTLTLARIVATVDGKVEPEQTTLLPLHWDIVHEGRSGGAELSLAFDLSAEAQAAREPHALFIARLGGAYEIELNGVVLATAGKLVGKDDGWSAKQPVTLSFASRLLRPHNELQIRIRADAGYRSGLSPVVVGPAAAVLAIAARSELFRVTLPQAISVFSLLVAGFCALLWWQQREPLYAWAAGGEALWAVTVADTVVEAAPLPWPYWGIALLLLRAAWAWSLYAIAEQACGPRPRGERRTMALVQAAAPICVLMIVFLHSTRPLLVWYVVNFSLWFWVLARLAAQAWREPTQERVMMTLALAAVIVASLRDVVAARIKADLYAESAGAKYVATLVGAVVMWIVSRRFLQARAEALQLNASLADRVDQKERELRDSFARLSEVESARAVLAERERILRDMHDGVGANLATAVRQLESGSAEPEAVVRTLRESMDHLKLSIDAMNLPAGDVNALLASLRYRLQPRIESAGLRTEWGVAQLPPWPAGHDEAMRHLQFLMLEAISNVLQHAGATTLSVDAHAAGGAIEITVADDGRGMAGRSGAGLRSMQVRAEAIGAAMAVEPASPGTRVTISLAAPENAPLAAAP